MLTANIQNPYTQKEVRKAQVSLQKNQTQGQAVIGNRKDQKNKTKPPKHKAVRHQENKWQKSVLHQ